MATLNVYGDLPTIKRANVRVAETHEEDTQALAAHHLWPITRDITQWDDEELVELLYEPERAVSLSLLELELAARLAGWVDYFKQETADRVDNRLAGLL